MKLSLVTLALLALVGTGCDTSKSNAADPSGTGATTTTTGASAPFDGKLTGDRVMASKGLVHPFDPWTAAQAKLEGQMGKATLVKNDKTYTWAVATGDDCWYVEVEKQADATVGIVQNPMKISKGGPIMNWDACLRDAGVRKEPVEDPNAAGPPTDAKPIDVVTFRDEATKARSKWDKATVTVRGLYLNVTTTESNGVTAVNVSITHARGDLDHTTTCLLADPKTSPVMLTQYTPIVVTGAVHMADMISMAGTTSVDVSLAHCTIVSPKK